jgi:ferredoxin--NADP+ reductase
LRDLPKLENTDVYIDSSQIQDAESRIAALSEIEKDLKNNLEDMRSIADHSKKGVERKLEIKFLASPIEFKGINKIEEVIFAQNRVENSKVVSSGKKFSIKCGLVISAIGYDSVAYPGITIESGRINNIAGHVEHNIYTTGWAKRGPTGVIGTNKSDSTDVVELIIENLKEPKLSEGITSLLKAGHEVIDQLAWEKINAFEVISGEIAGKPRVKEVDWKKMIRIGKSL